MLGREAPRLKKDYYYTTYNNNKAIIKANKAVASEKANPKIEYENNWFFKDGFLATPIIRHPNTTPIPTPAPARPIVANPAPISFDDSNI
nr:ATP synthase F0 subunit c [Fusarium oxysporum]